VGRFGIDLAFFYMALIEFLNIKIYFPDGHSPSPSHEERREEK